MMLSCSYHTAIQCWLPQQKKAVQLGGMSFEMLILHERCLLDSHHVQEEIKVNRRENSSSGGGSPLTWLPSCPFNQICHCSMINLWAVIYYRAVIWAPISKLRLPSTAVGAGRQSKAKYEVHGEPGSLESRMTSPVSKASSARSFQVQPYHFQLLKGCEEGMTGIYKEVENSQTLLFIYLLSKLTSR